MIRPAGPADAGDLARLRYEFRTSFGRAEESETDFLRRAEPWIRERLGPGRAWQAWLAEHEGTAVGTVWLQWIEKIPNPVAEQEWHGYITSLYVRAELRGRGWGAALLETALAACGSRGVDAVFLWPTPPSRSLYLRHGFTVRDDLMQRRTTVQ
jgi:GNAT superfamily N-acetyltransferase